MSAGPPSPSGKGKGETEVCRWNSHQKGMTSEPPCALGASKQTLRKNRLDPESETWLLRISRRVTCSLGCLLVRALEKARSSAQLQTNYPSSDNSLYTNAKGGTISAFDGGSDSSSESEPEEPQNRKKLRMEAS